MGEPIIIWPPDGVIDDPNDSAGATCENEYGIPYDCTEEALGGQGLACCY